MTVLTRRLDPHRSDCWRIHFGDVREMAMVIERSLRETLTETPDAKPEAAQLAA
jgi:hypothetical protein